jgi:hypothetical protein
MLNRQIGDLHSKCKNRWKVDFALKKFRPFINAIKFWMYFPYLNKPYMVIFNLYYYLSYFIYLLQVYIWYIFQIKPFKWCVINVWAIMHVDTHFLKLEYFYYNNVKPFKSSFSLSRFEALKPYFSIWITNVVCVFLVMKFFSIKVVIVIVSFWLPHWHWIK